MSTNRTAWTWRHAVAKSDLGPTTKHVLLTISLHMNDMGEGCYPTQEQLADETSLSDRAVRKHIDIAIEAGWLTKSTHGFRGQKWRNHEYQPAWPATQDVEGGEPDVEKGAEPRSSRSGKGAEPRSGKVRNHVPISISVPSNTPLAPQGGNRKLRKRERGSSLPLPIIVATERLNKISDEDLWKACVEIMGAPPPTSKINWSFPQEIVDQARQQVAA